MEGGGDSWPIDVDINQHGMDTDTNIEQQC